MRDAMTVGDFLERHHLAHELLSHARTGSSLESARAARIPPNRARLWRPDSHIDRSKLPSIGQMKMALTGGSAAEAERADVLYHASVRNDLY